MRVDSVGVLLLLVCCCSCAVKTLVVVDSHDMQLTHSAFFSSLRGARHPLCYWLNHWLRTAARGHELTIMEAQDPELSLEQYGTFQYDNLILFSPAADGALLLRTASCSFIYRGVQSWAVLST